MLKKIVFISACFLVSSVYANIPYCAGTQVMGSKHRALQKVVSDFARENDCVIANNCLHNFESIKYAINWEKDCLKSELLDNDPRGSTFYCDEGVCRPLGFFLPEAFYDENQK